MTEQLKQELKCKVIEKLSFYKDGDLFRRSPAPEKFSLYFEPTINTIVNDILNLKYKNPSCSKILNTTIDWWCDVLGLSNMIILSLLELI